jgi:hypothetical protein
MAMKAWRDAFFKNLDSKLIHVVVNLMEKERNGEVPSATSMIPTELVQSFKLLDGFKQKQWWATRLRASFYFYKKAYYVITLLTPPTNLCGEGINVHR